MPRVYPHIAELLQEQLGGAQRVLEIGCGAKQYGDCFRGRHVGIDLRATYGDAPGPGPDARADAHALPFDSDSVDGVFAVATLFLMEAPPDVLREVRRVLRPGGRVIVFDYSWWVARRLANYGSHERHRWSSRRLSRIMADAGLTPRVHTRCVPLRGPRLLRPLTATGIVRRLLYPVSNWIVVSGRKPETKPT